MRRVVSLWLPSWQTDRLRRVSGNRPPERVQAGTPLDGPAHGSRPLLTAVRQGNQRLIAAVDASASALGLHPGMAVAQAQAMVPDLDIAEADPAADGAALRRLAVWCLRRFTPLAAPDPPNGLWLDVTGCTHLSGGESALLNLLVDHLGRNGIAARAGVAGTPGAAHALARHAADPIASVGDDKLAAALDRLPVVALRLAKDTAQDLRRLGFETIGELMRAPRGPISRRFGSGVVQRLDQAFGRVREPIEPMAAPALPRSRMSFPEPIVTPEDLARATTLLARSLCDKLLRRGLGANRLDLLFRRLDGDIQAIRIGTSMPTRESAHMLRLLLPKIETIDPGFGIEAIMLTASLTDRLDAAQEGGLIMPEAHTADTTRLVDTLLNRLGPGRVFRAQPVESDIPERSTGRVAPLSYHGGRNWPDRLPRPPRLFDPPRPVDAMALLPDQPPVRFIWQRKTYRVLRADGPERVFGEWWVNPREANCDETWAVRDYFQVEDDAGQRFWLFRQGDGENPASGDMRWFLHGLFG